jgi:hypothetical protein
VIRRFLDGLWMWAEAYGTARAAAHMARLGMWREAQQLMERT